MTVSAAPAPASPEPSATASGALELGHVQVALERILPAPWVITEKKEDEVPNRWDGPPQALYVRLEDPTINVHHPSGYTYHPFIKLYFCPRDWSGRMEEWDYYGDSAPPFLLGKNHEYKVLYQTRGKLTWSDPWTALASTFDLTHTRVERDLRLGVDAKVRTRIAQRLAAVQHRLPESILDRIVGIDREGGLLYLEYAASVSPQPAGPGAPPLPADIRSLIERETRILSEEIFHLFPDVTAVYVRRVCDNRLFDEVMDRSAPPMANGASSP